MSAAAGAAPAPAISRAPAAAPAPPPAAPAPSATPVPTSTTTNPIVLKLNAVALNPSSSIRDPFYLDFDQNTQAIPGGWAAVNEGGEDFADIFHYPAAGKEWRILSSTYDSSLPVSLNLTINSVNETGKTFNFEIWIDLDGDGFNDSSITFPPYTTTKTLEPEPVNLPGTVTFFDALKSTDMNNSRLYLKVWRTDSVPENKWGIARIYAGYIYESTITLPWLNPSPTAVMAKPDNTETYWTSLPVTFSAWGSSDPAWNLQNLSCKWTFGDNSTPKYSGCESNQTHSFRNPGWYLVTLNVSNTYSFTDEADRLIYVAYKNIPPTASATVVEGPNVFVGNFSGFAGVPYNFSAVYDDIDNGKANVSLNWAFGDGGTSTSVNVTHTFDVAGNYNVTLQAFDGNDTTVSLLLANISQNRPPVLNVSIPARANKDSIVTFSAVGTFDPDGFPIASYNWNFGDQFCVASGSDPSSACDASSQVATHKYVVGGIVNVFFSAFDGIAYTNISASLKINEQPLPVCPASIQTETQRNVAFDGSLSKDPDKDTLLYQWKFGDGFQTEYSLDPIATHVYTVPKPEGYTAQLIVNDGLWTASCTVTVRVELLNLPPVAKVWCAASTLWLGDTLRCSGNQSQDEFELKYGWDFDASDGVSCVDDFRRDVQFTYQSPGQYVVTLCVTDNKGKEAEDSISIEVRDNPGYCNQIFDMSPFLRQSSLSPKDKTAGTFDTTTSLGTPNITAVKKGCWVAYSVQVDSGQKFFIDIDVKSTLEGDVVDLLMFDVTNFLSYTDTESNTLPPNSIDARCFEVGLRGSKHCEFTALKAGTIYLVIDNKDKPVLTPTAGPVEFHLAAKEPWNPNSPIDPALVPILVFGAAAAAVLVAVIWYLGRRAEKTYT